MCVQTWLDHTITCSILCKFKLQNNYTMFDAFKPLLVVRSRKKSIMSLNRRCDDCSISTIQILSLSWRVDKKSFSTNVAEARGYTFSTSLKTLKETNSLPLVFPAKTCSFTEKKCRPRAAYGCISLKTYRMIFSISSFTDFKNICEAEIALPLVPSLE